MIKRFQRIEGRSIQEIEGQSRLGFSKSDMTDFYDLIEWAERGGYSGSVLLFYDFSTGRVHVPFAQKKNVVYSDPRYVDGSYYFLRGDYDEQTVTLYRWAPDQEPETVIELGMEETDLYNLSLARKGLHIISQDNSFRCYYPEQISFPLGEHETVIFLEDGKVYCESWVEEGWDDEKNCATERYQYYDKVIIRDYEGNILSEEVGSLCQAPDGSWWIA